MRVLLIVCTTITILQILDVSITGVSAKPTETNRKLEKKPSKKITAAQSEETVSSSENEDYIEKPKVRGRPKTLNGAKKHLNRSIKKNSNKLQKELYTSTGDLFTLGTDTLINLKNHALGHAKNIHSLGKGALGKGLSLGNHITGRAHKTMNKFKKVGTAATNQVFDTVDHTADLTRNIVKVGGTVVNTPVSIASDAVAVVHGVARAPKKIVRTAKKTVLPLLGVSEDEDSSDENKPEEIEEENEEENNEAENNEEENVEPELPPKRSKKNPAVSPSKNSKKKLPPNESEEEPDEEEPEEEQVQPPKSSKKKPAVKKPVVEPDEEEPEEEQVPPPKNSKKKNVVKQPVVEPDEEEPEEEQVPPPKNSKKKNVVKQPVVVPDEEKKEEQPTNSSTKKTIVRKKSSNQTTPKQ